LPLYENRYIFNHMVLALTGSDVLVGQTARKCRADTPWDHNRHNDQWITARMSSVGPRWSLT